MNMIRFLFALVLFVFGVGAAFSQAAPTPKTKDKQTTRGVSRRNGKAIVARRKSPSKKTLSIANSTVCISPSIIFPTPIVELPSRPSPLETSQEFRVQPLNAAQLTARLKQPDESGKARPVLINFWATWCVPCREEFPDLVAVNQKFSPRGLDFFTVSVDEAELIATDVPAFLREMKATAIPAYILNAPDPAAAIDTIDATWTGALPATFLFDKSGRLVFKHTGRIKPAELTDAINKVLNDK